MRERKIRKRLEIEKDCWSEPSDAGNREVIVKSIYPGVTFSSALHCLCTCTEKADGWAQMGPRFAGKFISAQQLARNWKGILCKFFLFCFFGFF